MYALLKKQRIFLIIIFIVEMLTIATILTLYYLLPTFDNYLIILAILTAIFFLLDSLSVLIFNVKINKKKGEVESKSADILGEDIDAAYEFGEIGLAVCDKNNVVMWVNKFLSDRIHDLVDQNILGVLPELQKLINDDKPISIMHERHNYQVALMKEARLFIFKETTEYESIQKLNTNNAPVVGYLAIDNYYDVQMAISDDSKFSDAVAKVKMIIMQYASKNHILIRQIKEDRYILITTKENYDSILANRFSVVDDVKNKLDAGFTISLGFAHGFPDFSKLSEDASSALDVALSRGGDQTVVQPYGKTMSYYGGKTESKPDRNRVKMRTMSNSFLATLRGFSKVVIAGHQDADFDAIGACLGIYAIAKRAGIEHPKICYEEQQVEENCRTAINTKFTAHDQSIRFIDMKSLDAFIDDRTILIMVDHNNPNISIFPNIANKFKNIAIIDHHRPGNFKVENPNFSNIDPSASSTCELITSYIKYGMENIPLDSRTATFMLTGICLDTHFFKSKSSSATFDAASYLIDEGADENAADDFLKENIQVYQQKIGLMNKMEPINNDIIIVSTPDTEEYSDVMLSIVADEALTIRGVKCSFSIGRVNRNTIKCSARSDGTVNCQLLMEKLGGGGHLNMAAASFRDTSVDEVKNRLRVVLKDYLEDAGYNNKGDKA